MNFYGQKPIIKELSYLLEELKKGEKYNILFIAPSGYGKTTLALWVIESLGVNKAILYVPNQDGIINFDESKEIQCIDEAHTLKAQEILYTLMDSKKHIFIYASNETGGLKEPLRNRCIPFIFRPYQIEDIQGIVNDQMLEWNLPLEFIQNIAKRSKGNPRVTKNLCSRLKYIFPNEYPTDIKKLNSIFREILKINDDGLSALDFAYLDFLRIVGGWASLDNITFGSKIDKETVKYEVEPYLLLKGYIQITQKGRMLLTYPQDSI